MQFKRLKSIGIENIPAYCLSEAAGLLGTESENGSLSAVENVIFWLQETLIVWSEGDRRDLALSFQEKVGCDEIWEKICEVNRFEFFS
jgi:hypothetical protein